MSSSELKRRSEYSMLYFLKDPPNICSLTGLFSSFIGIYFCITGKYFYALIGVLWSVLFDWADGIIARSLKNRTGEHRAIGAQLDSLIDIVSFSVFPAIFLLSYGKFNPVFLPGAFLIVGAGAVRLSYFNVFGMIDKDTYRGLALDNNVIILSFLFIFEKFFSYQAFSLFIYAVMMLLLVFNLAPVRTYKFGDKWFYILVAYTVIMSVYFAWLQ
ncbi:MAG: CDP-alcohol phosphatidyltransferase family protein [Desulfotomaculaceae bacterium]|nr:CDP-alcohol phosphatidyltransferase family protein [Desulfotomaculaceae bacterium]